MSEDALQIPIGADLGDLQAAFSQIQGHVTRMGERINTSLSRSNAALSGTSRAAATISRAFTRVWQTIRAGAAAAFSGMVSAARSAASSIRSAVSGIMSLPGKMMGMMGGLKYALPIGGLLSLAGGIGMVSGSINKAAEMESLETAFAPLIGGADAAKARIAELSDFAAATPFELPEIARGSRILETLTKGALSTGDGLRMVGDVAAATQKPMDELAMWIGRLYDGLQSGRPVGEAMARLQEMGVISGNTRARIEAMQKSGTDGNVVWLAAADALNKFGGSMERQSVTWAGKISTLKDNVGLLMAEFGRPIIDALKPFLDMAIQRVEDLKASAGRMGDSIKTGLNLLMAAFQTGSLTKLITASFEIAVVNAVNKLAAGIRGSLAFMSAAMDDIMSAIGKGMRESGLEMFLIGIFEGIGNLLSSKITAAAADLADAFGMTGKASGLRGLAKSDEVRSGNYFQLAKGALASMDLSRGIDAMSDDMTRAVDAGKKAFKEAAADPFIDPAIAREKFAAVRATLTDQVRKNEEASAARMREMDDRLKNASPASASDSPVAAATRNLGVLTTSLGRVGGGGFGMTFFPMITEQKRGNALLGSILRKIPAETAAAPIV